MKKFLTLLVLVPALAIAANLVGEQVLPDGRRICIYSNGKTLQTTFNHCPSFIQD